MAYYSRKWKWLTTKYDAVCADCGAFIPAGTKVKYYFRTRKIYGIACHTKDTSTRRTAYEAGDRSPGAVASHYDRVGVYASDGQKIGSTCGCEDYPCCGH